VVIENRMKDLKVRTVESGLGGADCLLCASRRADWKDVSKIEDPAYFAINRTAEKTLDIYKTLLRANGELEKTNEGTFPGAPLRFRSFMHHSIGGLE
ncbi:unnamed protein product, partial [Didymodactylos carnosus]